MLSISPQAGAGVVYGNAASDALDARTFREDVFPQQNQETLSKLTRICPKQPRRHSGGAALGLDPTSNGAEELNQRYLSTSLDLARLRGPMFPVTVHVAALGLLLFSGTDRRCF